MAALPFRVRDSNADPSAAVKARGTHVMLIGELPEPMAGRRNLRISICELAAEPNTAEPREKVVQALLPNPVVNDTEQAKETLTAYLRVHADHVPQFM